MLRGLVSSVLLSMGVSVACTVEGGPATAPPPEEEPTLEGITPQGCPTPEQLFPAGGKDCSMDGCSRFRATPLSATIARLQAGFERHADAVLDLADCF